MISPKWDRESSVCILITSKDFTTHNPFRDPHSYRKLAHCRLLVRRLNRMDIEVGGIRRNADDISDFDIPNNILTRGCGECWSVPNIRSARIKLNIYDTDVTKPAFPALDRHDRGLGLDDAQL